MCYAILAVLIIATERYFETEIEMPSGYGAAWAGMFENMERAYRHFMLITPITVGVIFLMLIFYFGSFQTAFILLLPIPFAAGALALYLRDMNLNVSAGVGFAALFGIAVKK